MSAAKVCATYLLINVASVLFLLTSYKIGASLYELTELGESREASGASFLVIFGMLASMWAPIKVSKILRSENE